MSVQAYAVKEAKGKLEPFAFESQPLGPSDVEIAIETCGICHTDVHLVDNDFGFSKFPMVPGHEVVGRVASVGSAVENLSVGDRVGVGWQSKACLTCHECTTGNDNICIKGEATCVGRYGGLAEKLVLDSHYAFPIPDALSDEEAAPLLCAGATVYSPYRRLGIRGAHKVGVLGIGGLGHLALQFGSKMGCEMTAISHSPGKAEEAAKFGADHFLTYEELAATKNHFDFLLFTVSAKVAWGGVVPALAPNGTLCILGIPQGNVEVAPFDLVSGQRVVTGGAVGSRAAIREMLDFAARHSVVPQVEVFKASQLNEAFDRVREGKIRYRAVISL